MMWMDFFIKESKLKKFKNFLETSVEYLSEN